MDPPTYLRDLGDDVDCALELVVHDLVAPKAMARDRAEAAARIRAEQHLEFAQSNGFLVSARETAVWVAETVQEDLTEGRGNERPLLVWPGCPVHPNHPSGLRPRTAPDVLALDPYRVGKPLRDGSAGRYSARRGEFRVINGIHDDIVVSRVISVRHRRDACS